MSKITEEEIQKILPLKGPSFEEVKNYLINIMMNTSLLNVVVVF